MVFQVVDKFSNEFAKSAFRFEKVKTDTFVFRLHYKLSVWLVILYSACYMYVAFTTPISCITRSVGDKGIGAHKKEVSDYCWVHGTYVVENLDPTREIYPGIGGVTSKDDSIRFHHYYKWMYFYILVMIIMLHVPRQFWRNDDIEKEQDRLVEYLFCHRGYHRQYALGFVFGEFLNVFVSSSLLFLWDFVTEHEFSLHGTASFKVLKTPPSLRTDRLAKVFPLIGKCNFKDYGPSGSIQIHDFICILPLNLINERAAIFFWYYFMFLVTVGITALIFRVLLMTSKALRLSLLSGLAPLISREDLELLMGQCTYSDWFVLNQLGSCLEPVLFRQVLQKLVLKLQNNKV